MTPMGTLGMGLEPQPIVFNPGPRWRGWGEIDRNGND
jgi:hypothetical protein